MRTLSSLMFHPVDGFIKGQNVTCNGETFEIGEEEIGYLLVDEETHIEALRIRTNYGY